MGRLNGKVAVISVALRLSSVGADARPLHLAVIAGLACAFLIGKALPVTIDAVSSIVEPLCASSVQSGATQNVVEPIGSYALPNVAGKRVTDRAGVLWSRRLHAST